MALMSVRRLSVVIAFLLSLFSIAHPEFGHLLIPVLFFAVSEFRPDKDLRDKLLRDRYFGTVSRFLESWPYMLFRYSVSAALLIIGIVIVLGSS